MYYILYNSNMEARKKTSHIQDFNLFGEAEELPDVIHCETIETRSMIHDWEFKPHRHQRLHQILVLNAGGGEAILDDRHATLCEHSLINVPQMCVHSFVFKQNTLGWVVTLAAEFLDQVLRSEEGIRPVLAVPSIIESDARQKALVAEIFDEYAKRSFARAHILRSQSALLLGRVAQEMKSLDNSVFQQEDAPIRKRFEKLLEDNFQKHWKVSNYAHEISVSPTHLSRVLRQATGLSASRLIEARVLREARRQLFFTNLGVSQVAYHLGYEDPAYFSRVFSRATGMSPKAFRAQTERSA